MKTIPLTKGEIAFVDDEDYDFLSQFKWRVYYSRRNKYAIRSAPRIKNGREVIKWMHKDIYDHHRIAYIIVDHKNMNGLDNQKSNLRPCTIAQNNKNRKSAKNSTSKFLGVSWRKSHNGWVAQINRKGSKFLGLFKKEEDAARAYNKAAKEIHGEFANLNRI